MRDRETILAELTFRKQFQGTLAQKAIIELLMDLREQNEALLSGKKKPVIVSGFQQT